MAAACGGAAVFALALGGVDGLDGPRCATHQRGPFADCGPDALIAGRRLLRPGPTPIRPLGLQNRLELWAHSPTPYLASARASPSAAARVWQPGSAGPARTR